MDNDNVQKRRMEAGDRGAALWRFACACFFGIGLACNAPAQNFDQRLYGSGEVFQVPLSKSAVIPLAQPAKQISVGSSAIADIIILNNRQLYVVGRGLGTTNVMVWDARNRLFQSFNVEVTPDLGTLKEKLYELLPGENIKVYSAQERIILTGEVSNVVKMSAAEELAASFLAPCKKGGGSGGAATFAVPSAPKETESAELLGVPESSPDAGTTAPCKEGSVVNLLQVGGAQQVMLEIKVAEMARTVLKRLDSDVNFLHFGNDVQLGVNRGGASFPDALNADGLEVPIFGNFGGSSIGPSTSEIELGEVAIDASGAFLQYLSGDFLFEWVLDVSREKGLAKILAEPTLTTLTGQQAEFLSGGEFPIPVPQGGNSNAITIEFKQFGVGVRFVPVVLDSGRISLKLNVDVSELSAANNVLLTFQGTPSTFVIPSLTKRSAQSSVELADGQTIGIAGLINDNLRELVDKFPGLGDVPVLGALFRSQEYQGGQTELVMFVTPHLARPISAQQVRLPTDSFVPPDDLEFYLMGKMEKRSPKPPEPDAAQGGGAEQGKTFGHEL
ncbi:MAG: type II and III secretion system protein family protein [Gammaproteobacteria bacterium]